MTSLPIITIEEINVDKLELKPPKTEKVGGVAGKMYHVFHNNVRLRAIMPEMLAPFGAGNSKDYPDKYSMGISFEGMDEDTPRGRRLKRAHSKAVEIDKKILELIMENKDLLFKDAKKKGVTNDILRSRYKSFINSYDDEKKADRMYLSLQPRRIKDEDLPKYTEEQRLEITNRFQSMPKYDLLKNAEGPLDITKDNVKDMVPWGSRVKPVMEFAYLWVTSDKCYPVWSLVHGLLVSTNAGQHYEIRADDDDDDEESDERMEEDDVENEEKKEDTASSEDEEDKMLDA